MPKKLTSRKFWIALIGAAIMAVNGITDLGLDTGQAVALLLPLIAYILGESWADGKR
tara:strand:+ start:3822 stop:3992 length:171 start_codon:yes stop_codon:yes gene_type:complete